MARTADPPAVRAAKGNVNRRKSANAARVEKAKKVADVLMQSFGAGAVDAVPVLLAGDAEAVSIWQALAPILAKTQRLQVQHRPIFAMFCDNYAQWVIARNHIREKGATQIIRTTSGSEREVASPMVQAREMALKNCLELARRFGLTPADEFSLFKDQAAAAAINPWLFGDDGGQAQRPQDDAPNSAASPAASGIIGGMAKLDGTPPTLLN